MQRIDQPRQASSPKQRSSWLQLKWSLALIPVIVVSARDARGNKERALKAGAKAFLQKPWNDSQLLAEIARHIGDAAPAPGKRASRTSA